MDTQHSSNANSSLISTLSRVKDAEVNPFVYSVGKYIESHASQKLRILPENNQAVTNGVTVFNIPKLGLLCDATLSFGIAFNSDYNLNTADPPASMNARGVVPCLHGRGLLQLVRRVEFCNENREIFTLTQDAIMALYSDLSRAGTR